MLKLNHPLIDFCFFLFLLIFNVHAQFAIMAKSSGLIPEIMFNKRYNVLNILFNKIRTPNNYFKRTIYIILDGIKFKVTGFFFISKLKQKYLKENCENLILIGQFQLLKTVKFKARLEICNIDIKYSNSPVSFLSYFFVYFCFRIFKIL